MINYVDNLPKENIIKFVEVGIKANIDAGIKEGIKKRRIQFLINTITEAQRELRQLLEEN